MTIWEPSMSDCGAATPERIVGAKRFMGKLEKLYKVRLHFTHCKVAHKLQARGHDAWLPACRQADWTE